MRLARKTTIPIIKHAKIYSSDGNKLKIRPVIARGDNNAIKGTESGKILLSVNPNNTDEKNAPQVGQDGGL